MVRDDVGSGDLNAKPSTTKHFPHPNITSSLRCPNMFGVHMGVFQN